MLMNDKYWAEKWSAKGECTQLWERDSKMAKGKNEHKNESADRGRQGTLVPEWRFIMNTRKACGV